MSSSNRAYNQRTRSERKHKTRQAIFTYVNQLCPSSVTSPGDLNIGVLSTESIDAPPFISAFIVANNLRMSLL
jgi:hypothetical protein